MSNQNKTHWFGAVRHCSRKSMQLLQPTRESMRNMKVCMTSKHVWVGYSVGIWKYGKIEVLWKEHFQPKSFVHQKKKQGNIENPSL